MVAILSVLSKKIWKIYMKMIFFQKYVKHENLKFV